MPVEIRELVIQAKLKESEALDTETIKPGPSQTTVKATEKDDDDSCECQEKGPAWENSIMEKCLAMVKEWLSEQTHR